MHIAQKKEHCKIVSSIVIDWILFLTQLGAPVCIRKTSIIMYDTSEEQLDLQGSIKYCFVWGSHGKGKRWPHAYISSTFFIVVDAITEFTETTVQIFQYFLNYIQSIVVAPFNAIFIFIIRQIKTELWLPAVRPLNVSEPSLNKPINVISLQLNICCFSAQTKPLR